MVGIKRTEFLILFLKIFMIIYDKVLPVYLVESIIEIYKVIQKERIWCIVVGIDKSRNVRINLTLPKKMYNKIQLLAKEDMRSANSLIVFLASQTLNEPEWKEKTQKLIDAGLLQE